MCCNYINFFLIKNNLFFFVVDIMCESKLSDKPWQKCENMKIDLVNAVG
jgi:hypothetical protein